MSFVDALFDARTGYHVITKPAGHFDRHPLGEGDESRFVIVRGDSSAIPKECQGRRVCEENAEGEPEVRAEGWTKKLDLDALTSMSRTASGSVTVVWAGDAQYPDGTPDENLANLAALDTHRHAVLTIGTAKTYATITAAIIAASSGDVLEAYATGANTYAETVDTLDKLIQIVGKVAAQGLKIAPASGGQAVLIDDARSLGLMDNFEVEKAGTVTHGVITRGTCRRLKIHGFTGGVGLWYNTLGFRAVRSGGCIVSDCQDGFYSSASNGVLVHCTAVDNSRYGFSGATNSLITLACLAAENGTADFNAAAADGTYSSWNVAADATAPGAAPVTGFDKADFTSYAGDDFTLDPAKAATTKARLLGYPFGMLDFVGRERKLTAGVFFAGASDPDPGPELPTAQPTITSVTVNHGTGAVSVAWVPGEVGNTGKLYRRQVGVSKAWGSPVDSGTTSPLSDTLTVAGLYEYMVEEEKVAGLSGLASNAERISFVPDGQDWALVLAQIKATLLTVSGIGNVHDYLRHTVFWDDYFTRNKAGGMVHVWEISRLSKAQEIGAVQAAGGNEPRYHNTHRAFLRGFMSVDDSAATEKAFQNMVDDIVAAFRLDNRLGGTALLPRFMQVRAVGHRTFGGVLCHFAEIDLEVVKRVGG